LGRPLSGIRRENNKCQRNFPTIVVREADNTGIYDVRMLQQMAFNFSGGYLKAPNFQNFLHKP